jgi:hypothetical protein
MVVGGNATKGLPTLAESEPARAPRCRKDEPSEAKQIDVLPLTRDYMTDAEQWLTEQDLFNARVRLVGETSG